MTPASPDKSIPVPERWWFNLKTRTSEFGRFTDSANRVGPFDSKDEADHALQTLNLRSQQWAEEESNEV